MSMRESLTLEETNKERIKLGLAPITDEPDEDAPPDADAIAEANFTARKEGLRRAKEERETLERIEKARNQRALNSKLKGSTLGDKSKDDGLSAKDWAKKLKKRTAQREKEIAARRMRDMEEADAASYGEEDLVGLKVAHGADAFEEGQDVVLTLKDSGVLEDGEDELQNVNMVDDDAVKAKKERKRKAQQAYTGYDDEEFEDGRIGRKADVLSKYDEDYSSEGKLKTEGFRLGAAVETKKNAAEDGDIDMISFEPGPKVKLDLNFATDFEVSDYMKEGDAGFKRPKKRKAKKSSRRAEREDDDMDIDPAPTFERRRVTEGPDNLVDDDDLQSALARSRRANARKRPRVKAEDLAAQITQQRKEEEAVASVQNDDAEEDGRITFDETSEFVRNVTAQSRAAPVKTERKRTATSSPPPSGVSGTPANGEPVSVKVERVDADDMSEDEGDEEDDALAEMAAREGLSLEEYRQRIDSQMKELSEMNGAESSAPTEAEPVVSQGVAGVLAMLRNQGSIEKREAGSEERERRQKQHDLWLADHQRRLAQRELERVAARGGNKDQAQLEYEKRQREQAEARDALESFKNYRPDVTVAYHDEFGRVMTPKEAWKSLSHKFHGKTSGRMKTEKRLRKIEEERRQQSMTAGDTPLGMTDAFARRAQKTGEAFMVLSAGNKGSVQMDQKPKRR